MKKMYLLLKLVSFVMASICYGMHDYNSAIFMGISAIYMQQEQMMLED